MNIIYKLYAQILTTMRNICTILMVLLFATEGFAQLPTVFVTPKTATAAVGQDIDFDIYVRDFNNLLGIEFKIEWDKTVFEYVSISNITTTLPGFTAAGNIGNTPPNTTNGRVVLLWFDNSFTPFTMQGENRLLTLTLRGLKDGVSAIAIKDALIVTGDEMQLSPNVENSNATSGTGGGGGSTNNNPIAVTLGNVTGQASQQVCVPVTVSNFADMQSLQLGFSYNPSILQSPTINNINLTDLSTGSFALPPAIAAGSIRMSWSDATSNTPETVANNTKIFDLCFTVAANATAGTTPVSISNTVFASEARRANVGAISVQPTNSTVTIQQGSGGGGGGSTGEFRLTAANATANTGATVCLDVTASGFNNILALQHSINWNQSLLRFKEVKTGSNPLNIQLASNFNTAASANGQISFSWEGANLQPVTIPNGTIIYQLCFDVIGNAGQNAMVQFTSTPTPAEVSNGAERVIPFNSTPGVVSITGGSAPAPSCDPTAFPVCISKETVQFGNTACVSITAQDFRDIVGLQFSITFDRSVLQYADIQIANTPLGLTLVSGTSGGNINRNAALTNGVIVMLWEDPSLAGVSLDDDTELFKICFNTLKEGVGLVAFQNMPTPFEVTDKNSNILPFRGSNGSVTVSAACSAPVIEGAVTNISCVGQTSGAIDLSITGGNGSFTYNWGQGRPATQDLSNLGAGTYTVTVTSGGGCGTANRTFTITQPATALAAQAQVAANVQCFGQNTGRINVTASGGTGNYTYTWSPNQVQGATPSNLPAGNYNVTVTDQNGCQASVSNLAVTGPTQAVTVMVEKTDAKCAGENNGAIRLNASGGTGNYTYSWASPLTGTSSTQANLRAGTYTATVTDANGCQANTSVVIEGGGTPISVTDTTINRITNNNGSITISVSGGSGDYTFDWSGPEAFERLTKDINNLRIPGPYTVKITDSNGCSISETYVVAVPMALSTSRIKPACGSTSDGAIEIEIIGGIPPYQYLWSNGGNSKNLTALAPGSYTPTITDASGDTFTPDPFVIGTSPSISVAENILPETCSDLKNDGSITITPTGGTAPLTWKWETQGFDNIPTRTNLNRGNYVYTITDAIGCTKTDTVVVAYIPSEPELSNFDIKNVTCSGLADGRIAFDISCGDPDYVVSLQKVGDTTILKYTYDFANPRFEVANLATGTYKISVTDRNDGSESDEISITAPEIFNTAGTVSSSTEIFAPCNGQIRLNVTGGSGNYTYLWSNNATSSTITSACAGRYTVTVTDAQGCQQIDTFQLTNLNANGVVNNADCPDNDPSGSVILNVQSGQPPYAFEWRNSRNQIVGDSTQNLMNAEAGSYTVKITEESGVSITRTFQIGANSDLGVSARFGANYNGFGVSCKGAQDAVLIAEGKNSQNYTYEWKMADSTLSNTEKLEAVGVGNYRVFVTDDEGCTSSANITVVEPPLISVSREVLDILCAGDQSGEAILIPSGGASSEYTFKWSHDSSYTFGTAAGLSPGNYVVTISDKNNCSIVDSFAIIEPDPLLIDVDNTPFSVDINGSVEAVVTGGTGAYSYTWIDIASGKVISTDPSIEKIKSEISLTLIVEDENLCRDSLNTSVFNLNECLTNRSVITPNGDGKNETFEIKCIEFYGETNIQIFSRWGQLVFFADNYDGTWSGRDMDGTLLPDDAYFYVLRFIDIDDKMKEARGTVTIMTE